MSSKSAIVPQAMEHYDYRVKLIIIGDANSGKSCLLEQFRAGRFYAGSTHTIGVEFASKVVTVGDKRVKLQIWDTYVVFVIAVIFIFIERARIDTGQLAGATTGAH